LVEYFSVEMRDVLKRHGTTTALDRISIAIRKGEFFSILGPSGSGKTTTLRLLAGFETPDGGDIYIEGQSMAGIPPNRRPVNLVFQSYALFPHLTVARNVSFGLEMQGLPRATIMSRTETALDMVRLSGKRDRYPAQLSGGEQQRVALARALVNRPAVLLLDEPLAALDQQLRQSMQSELKTIQRQVGITFLYVTHHQEEALTMSDRLAVMDRGHVLQVGSPQDVYEKPVSLFVASFIGTSNKLPARIVSFEGRDCRLEAPSLPEPNVFLAAAPSGAPEGSSVTLVIRPERLHVSRETSPDRFDNCLRARVTKVLYAGKEILYDLCVSEDLSWQARVTNEGGERKPLVAGESVYAHWNLNDGVITLE
jgi:spermidine/putrescine transport system ATP-binding protein